MFSLKFFYLSVGYCTYMADGRVFQHWLEAVLGFQAPLMINQLEAIGSRRHQRYAMLGNHVPYLTYWNSDRRTFAAVDNMK